VGCAFGAPHIRLFWGLVFVLDEVNRGFLGRCRAGLRTVAVDVLAVVVITGLLRRRLGARVFRVVHWATYALWPIAMPTRWAMGPTPAGSGSWRSPDVVP